MTVPVSLELGPKRRVFAQAWGWIGWCRAGRDEAAALAALLACSARYGRVAAAAGLDFAPPEAGDLEVAERLEGTATTDFGAPARPCRDDLGPADDRGLTRSTGLLRACWAAFDAALEAVPAPDRAVEPRIGRAPAAMRLHVCDADVMHLSAFGPSYREPAAGRLDAVEAATRAALLEGLAAVPRGVVLEPQRRYGFAWTPLFAARRAAWHALDHAWDLEDRRAVSAPPGPP